MSGKREKPSRRPLPTFDPGPSSVFAVDVFNRSHMIGALIGRLAVWAWLPDSSEHELTKDADFAVSRAALRKIRDLLRSDGRPTRELGIGGINVYDEKAGINVDFIERTKEGDLSPLYEAAIKAALARGYVAELPSGDDVPLVPVEHLIAMKLGTGRPEKDEKDVKRLMANVARIDIVLVRRLVRDYLGPAAQSRFEEMLRETNHPDAKRAYKQS